jgi:uncharacterized membrane protein YfbV (UPF0208 family)
MILVDGAKKRFAMRGHLGKIRPWNETLKLGRRNVTRIAEATVAWFRRLSERMVRRIVPHTVSVRKHYEISANLHLTR